MFASARHVSASVCVAALFLGTVAPVAASDDRVTDSKTRPASDTASPAEPPAPGVATSLRAIVSDAAQLPRPIEMSAPVNDRAGFGAPALRRSSYVTYSALQVMDIMSTRKALSGGAREANPAMGGLVKNSAALMA